MRFCSRISFRESNGLEIRDSRAAENAKCQNDKAEMNDFVHSDLFFEGKSADDWQFR
ncbi:hypothetical protein Bache_0771 [Bacteroides helcogenes P 36-108]|uniref:Uncharacterized protein n=1 Tax=Bacteroides helcogenes (strain ATCC 35417 / DSM 20613 / JCM 6297 / CCUG 15421 / P 36-108) TaxID=693979 RepID=E6SNX5_BACT6|nr:hypothetical protein Bache_0771 [Bacteroides helcogenes P 36-108]